MTHGLVEEEFIAREAVGAEETPEDADGALKKVDIHVLVQPQVMLDPIAGELEQRGEGERQGLSSRQRVVLVTPASRQHRRAHRQRWGAEARVCVATESCAAPHLEFVLQAHDDHQVQGVHQRQPQPEPLVELLGDGQQLVVAPGVFAVACSGKARRSWRRQ